MNELRQQLRSLLAACGTQRPPALRRSLNPVALYATDLPQLAAGTALQAFRREAEKAGWTLREEDGWLQLDRAADTPPRGWYAGAFGPEAAACLSLLRRQGARNRLTGNSEAGRETVRRLIKAGEMGETALETACAETHREWAARLREGKPLPALSEYYFLKEEESMIIMHAGHAKFVIELEDGTRIVTDPFDASCGYPIEEIRADVALVSHGHHDHNAVDTLQGEPRIIDREGVYTVSPSVRVTAVKGYHDDQQGAQRGETLLFLLEAEGLRVVHLGDLGCDLTEDQISVLKKPDLLMIPVGGHFTIDAAKAHQIADILEARVILPMHYKTRYNRDWPITGPEDFLEYYQDKTVCRDLTILRVTKGDLVCQPKVILFKAP